MSRVTLAGVPVDGCPSCFGIWLEASELSSALNSNVPEAAQSELTYLPPIEIQCPRCNIKVSSSTYAHDSGIPINKCPQCAGVWLRNGQLQQIVYYKTGSPGANALASALAADIATSNRWSRTEEIAKSRALSTFVAIAILITAFLITGRLETVLRMLAGLLFPMACIWFADGMGHLTGISMGLFRPRITVKSPGLAVALCGWLLMVTILVVMIYRFI